MKRGGTVSVHKVKVNTLVSRQQHFNSREVEYLSCEGKMSFIIGPDVTFHGTLGDSVTGKCHRIAGGKQRLLLWEIRF